MKTKKQEGCRLCKFRVSVPQGDTRVPVCCFKEKIDDKRSMEGRCSFFIKSDYYVKHPEDI